MAEAELVMRPLPEDQEPWLCDGEVIVEGDVTEGCLARAEFMVLWGERLCRDCLARLVAQGQRLLEGG